MAGGHPAWRARGKRVGAGSHLEVLAEGRGLQSDHRGTLHPGPRGRAEGCADGYSREPNPLRSGLPATRKTPNRSVVLPGTWGSGIR